MKPLKTILLSFLVLFITFYGLETHAQNFEGVIQYEIPEMQSQQMGNMAYMIKGSKVRMEMGEGPRSAAMLFFPDKSEMVIIIDQMKGYMKMDMDKQSSGSDNDELNKWKDSKMEKTGQTKTIAGHTCEIWKVENKEGTKYNLCMAEGLGTFITPGNPMDNQNAPAWARSLASGEYMPLEVIEIKEGEESLQMRATSIKEKSLDVSMFEVPENYRDMSAMMEQMQNQKKQ